MCFSNKVQVKYNLLENFAFKNLWKRDKGWPDILKKGLWSLKYREDLLKTKRYLYRIRLRGLINILIIRVCILMQKMLI